MKFLFLPILILLLPFSSAFAEDKSYKVDLDNDGREELIITEDRFATDLEGVITVSALDKSQSSSFSMPDHFNRLEFISLNKDGFKQIVAWSSGGAHYTNIAIYGYKDGSLYEIFKNGSACGILTYFYASPSTIGIGSPNWGAKVLTEEGEEINWSYASEPLWKVYVWDGRKFIYRKDLSTSFEFSEDEELERYLDKAKSLRQGKK